MSQGDACMVGHLARERDVSMLSPDGRTGNVNDSEMRAAATVMAARSCCLVEVTGF